jgi:serine protease inhibitor
MFLFVFPDDVADMVVLIINTLYFKGTWRHQFAPNATKYGVFYATPRQMKTVPFMNIRSKFLFIESSRLDAKILRMSYTVSFIQTYFDRT